MCTRTDQEPLQSTRLRGQLKNSPIRCVALEETGRHPGALCTWPFRDRSTLPLLPLLITVRRQRRHRGPREEHTAALLLDSADGI